jgi:hypothetical protein
MRLEEIGRLTVRQISFLYYRERDKQGRPKPLPYYFAPRAEKRMAQLEMFRQFGRQVGKTDEEIEQIIQEAMRNGSV